MRLRRPKKQEPETIDRNFQKSDKMIGALVTNFVEISAMMLRMVGHLGLMGYHGLNNALKNRPKDKAKNKNTLPKD